MDGKKMLHSRSPLLTIRVEQSTNGTLVASIIPQKRTHGVQDDLGALYYVVAVILIYGCSIVMMIASYIRRNKDDRRLKRCLKEMAFVRKRELHMSLMWAATKAANLRRNAITPGQADGPSEVLTGPTREQGQADADSTGFLESTVWVKQTQENPTSGEIPLDEAPPEAASPPPDQSRSEVVTSKSASDHHGRRSLDCRMIFRPSLQVSPCRRSSTQLTVPPRMTFPRRLLTVPKVDAKGKAEAGSAEDDAPIQRPGRKQSCPSLQVISIF